MCRTGCQWCSLPACFPPGLAVYHYFTRWQTMGIMQRLNEAANRAAHRRPTPSLALVDAQGVKLAPRVGWQRGLDANKHKRVDGHKRQVLCDTGGRIWRVHVHAANGHNNRAARPLLPFATHLRPTWASRLHRVLTDKAYCGEFAYHLQALGWQHQVSSHPHSATRGFVPVNSPLA